ncbi:MAG TPA: S9 family peptidase [Acidobacteriota bacterium]|nr:S9 family peptidase [Acidobacteriota bacterium]
MNAKKTVTPEHLHDFQFLDAAVPSPDGSRIVYQIRTMDAEKDGYQSHLWLVNAAGGAPRRLTQGEHKNGGAVWSPDGLSIAFVSARKEKRAQIHRLRMDGGEAEPLTDLDGDVSGLQWSPDGATISFVYRPHDPPEFGHLPGSKAATKAAEAKKEGKELPPLTFRHVTRLSYKFDGAGYLPQARAHIHVLDVATRTIRAITSGDWDHEAPVWSPDGKWLAFTANREPDAEYSVYTVYDLYVVSAQGGEPRNLTPGPGMAMAPSWSPDGATIAFLGHDKPDDWWGIWNFRLWVVPLSGGAPKNLTPDLDRTAMDVMIGDLHDHVPGGGPVWSRDGRTIHFLCSEHGSTHVFSVPAQGGPARRLTKGAFHVMALDRGRQSDDYVAIRNGFGNAGAVERFDPASGTFRTIVEPNAPLFAGLAIGEPEEIWLDSPKGHKVQAWLLKPPNADPTRKHPMLLEIHGGPRAMYGATYMHEFQVFANAGFYVLFSNPRGSLGYGEAYTQAIVKDWGGPAFDDVMLAVDEALRLHPEIDVDRLGVTGGSYGGYLTSWVVGHTDRFKAALTQRTVTTIPTLLLCDDIGGSSESEFGAEPWTFAPKLWEQSPLAYVERIKTPLMITHSSQDLRCNLAEAEMLYKALKWLRREVELVIYPNESHGLSRMGAPSRRVARLHVMLDWFVRHLKPEGAPEPVTEAGVHAMALAGSRRA